MEKEIVKATEYLMNWKNFSKETTRDGEPIYDWSDALWRLFNAKNSSRHDIYKLDVIQGGKDENGFYPNIVQLIVKEEDEYNVDWDGYLSSLGYNYSKYEINLLILHPEWNEDICDAIVDWD